MFIPKYNKVYQLLNRNEIGYETMNLFPINSKVNNVSKSSVNRLILCQMCSVNIK